MFKGVDIALLTRLMRRLLNRLLPPICLLCDNPLYHTEAICQPCQQDLPILPQHCPQCAQFLPTATPAGLKCGQCLTSPPDYAKTYALFPYASPIMQLIIRLKFQHQLPIARALGILMAERIHTEWYVGKPLPDLILPIPLHARRLRERGFNQALEIAKPLSRRLKLPLDRHGVKRIRNTAAQSGLTASARLLNMKNAFHTTVDYSGLTVAIIDDVVTTGNTVNECSRLLKNRGAAGIDVWCVAKRG